MSMPAIVYLRILGAMRVNFLVRPDFTKMGKVEIVRLPIVLVVWDWHSNDVMKW